MSKRKEIDPEFRIRLIGECLAGRMRGREAARRAGEPFPQKRTQNRMKKPNKNAEIKCTAIRRRKRQVQLQNLQANASQGQNGG